MRRLQATFELALIGVLALVLSRPAAAGFVSDDLLLSYLLDKTSDTVRVDWGAVLADFGRPWLGLEGGELYRPIMTLSYALNLATTGASALGLQWTNVIAHAISTICVAMLCRALCPARPRLAAWLGAALFTVHPASVESVEWISGRVSSLETMWSLLALVVFVRHLETRCPGRLVAAAGLAMLALWTKESAAVLPVSLVAIDVLWHLARGERLRVRAWIARHAVLVPVWTAYVVLRWNALGALLVVRNDGAPAPRVSELLASLGAKIAALAGGSGALAGALTIALALLVLAAIARRRDALAMLVLLGWVLATLAPGYRIRIDGWAGSRLVYGTVPCLALLAAMAFAAPQQAPRARVARRAGIAVCAALAIVFFVTAQRLRADWAAAKAEVTAIASALRAIPSQVARPRAVLRTPSTGRGNVPLLNPNAVFPLVEVPFARESTPLVGLNCVLEQNPNLADLYWDASPLRALSRAGASIVSWEDGAAKIRGRETGAPGPLARAAEGSAEFRFATPTSPYQIEALAIATRVPVRGGRVVWLPEILAVPEPLRLVRFAAPEPQGATRLTVALTHAVGLVAHEAIDGFRIELDGTPASEIASVHAVHALPRLALTDTLAGAELTLGREHELLRAPDLDGQGTTLRLVLLGPNGAHAVPVQPGLSVRFPARVVVDLRRIRGVYRQRGYWYYFEATSAGATAERRSELDWFRLR